MKTIMTVLLLLTSTSLLAGKPDGVGKPDWVGKPDTVAVTGGDVRVIPTNLVSVPEPSILALIGLGIAGLVVTRKRKI